MSHDAFEVHVRTSDEQDLVVIRSGAEILHDREPDQAGIHQLMIRAAHRRQRVVRLKAGDPFVLGRGGEEALALDAAGVAYEVVPGLSSAIAAPLLAGIPLTHRGITSDFAVISGHAEAAYAPTLDSIAPNALTLVVLMGVAQRVQIAARLIARGWAAHTPAALLFGASQPGSFTQITSLGWRIVRIPMSTFASTPSCAVHDSCWRFSLSLTPSCVARRSVGGQSRNQMPPARSPATTPAVPAATAT